MVLFLGLVLVLSGLSIAVATWSQFWPFLRGFIALSLLFWGAILLIVGFSERRARRLYQSATQESPDASSTPTE